MEPTIQLAVILSSTSNPNVNDQLGDNLTDFYPSFERTKILHNSLQVANSFKSFMFPKIKPNVSYKLTPKYHIPTQDGYNQHYNLNKFYCVYCILHYIISNSDLIDCFCIIC